MANRNDPAATSRKGTLQDVRRHARYSRWLYVIVLSGAFLMAAGALISAINPLLLAGPGEQLSDGVRIYAGYLFSRNLVIGLMLLAALFIADRRPLCTLMVVTALIQFLDTVMNLVEQRWTIIPLALVIGIAFLIGARHVAGGPLWRISSWD